ncbi:MAG: hypothetical protein Q4C42_05255, partial [Clostridia bacterium]|nr:hypothetical protein [Clostridia bacterium]
SLYGDKYKIYKDKDMQGVVEPCFFIRHISTACEPRASNQTGYRHLIETRFHTDDVDQRNEVNMDFVKFLDLINLGDFKLHGFNIDGVVSNDVLVMTSTYYTICIDEDDVPLIEDAKLIIDADINGKVH